MKTKTIPPFYRLIICALALAMTLISCEKNENFEETSVDEPKNQTDPIVSKTIPEPFIEKFFLGEKVKVRKEEDGTYSLQGTDVRLFENQFTSTPVTLSDKEPPSAGISSKLGLGGGVRKWTNNTIVYVTRGLNSSVRSELRKSMDEWTSKTNVRFKERTNEANYITISSNGENCNCGVATLGMNGSRGFIRLGTRTTALVIIHEIGHTLGYIHEQNRSDRDDHVIINYENIQEGAESQFYKSYSADLVTRDFDINSTMMYGSYTFSKNGRPTITDINGNLVPRRRAALSALDIQGTNKIYPSDDGNPDPDPDPSDDPCEGVEEWQSGQRYYVGDRVTYQGYLYERDYTRWNQIAKCSTGTTPPPSDDICEGIDEYDEYEIYYPGDQVTYNGYLYTLDEDGYWNNEGACG